MPNLIEFDYSASNSFIDEKELNRLQPSVQTAHQQLHDPNGVWKGSTGWVHLPVAFHQRELVKIQTAARKIQSQSDAFLVIGIGGSYLGSRAAIEMLSHSFYNLLPADTRQTPQVFFAGQNISSVYLTHLLEILQDKEISLNVISKSGTTTEPAIAFRIFRDFLEKKYGKQGARERIYVTTDSSKGALRQLAEQEGYETFAIPDDVGGRYSVLTAVGLLPMAVAGIDVESVLAGAADAYHAYSTPLLEENDCYRYASIRNLLYQQGKTIEILVNYEPALHCFAEWWKQLYGESEGKDGKGIFPASADFSTDLHSMGQYIQDGRRNLFETVLFAEKSQTEMMIGHSEDNGDELNFLSGNNLQFINRKAFEGAVLAHSDGGVPNLVVRLPEISPYTFGNLVYFFEKACGISGRLLGVNPFNQPGVESYKKNMFALLGKPGYEDIKISLQKRLESSQPD
ncbi:glucose-6-phosphate isomerase [Effusibacillus dendaii]|uniref:Glucose-6-phosphate isomerase n=1 Tax=Effusibacillus dendaii TaxID=2743772 RepID=A0A7I8D9X6_9BACL|nr:glucose-6-phosphate isomerase [Effusibacillus dendaii]BCJ86797.1 glucose-6-phosphate isomerase [Effusibacillus dendaii]